LVKLRDERNNLIEFVFDANVPYTAPTKEDPPFKNSAYNYAIPG